MCHIYIYIYISIYVYIYIGTLLEATPKLNEERDQLTGRLAALHQPWPLDAMCFSGFRLAAAARGSCCTFISLIDVPCRNMLKWTGSEGALGWPCWEVSSQFLFRLFMRSSGKDNPCC